MDIVRQANPRKKMIRRLTYGGTAVLALAFVGLGVARLSPAAPAVDRATVWIDTVKRGPMVREVRGIGTLVPEDIRWIPATTQGRVEAIVLRPGTAVKEESVILELSNPELEQELIEARLKVDAAEASVENLRAQTENEYLQQRSAAATVTAEYNKAKMSAEMNEALAQRQLVSVLVLRQSQVDAEQLATRARIADDQVASYEHWITARLAVQKSELAQARAILTLKQQQRDALHVRAGLAGVLQVVPVEVGQQVAPGTNLARVANPGRLKAEIKIAETQAKDIQLGQLASVDTRNGVVDGVVSRLDPSVLNGTRTVDVTLHGALPSGAVPDLSVDGTIELERLPDVLFVGRPTSSQDQSTVGLFKLQADGTASRVNVRLGRSSVSSVEILSGLAVGEQVILSDMSSVNNADRVRIQ